MNTELGLLILWLTVCIFVFLFVSDRILSAVKGKSYTVGIRAKLRKNENEWVFERFIDLEIPPAVGQIIQYEGGFEVIDVLPAPLSEKCCCYLNCEILTAENFNVDSYIKHLLKYGWECDEMLSDPLPKRVLP
jgi:hypothetical protein